MNIASLGNRLVLVQSQLNFVLARFYPEATMPDSSSEAQWLRDTNKGVPDVTPKTEQEARVQLAACYRLSAYFHLDDVIYTHISARVPGEPNHFLLNPYGLMFREVKASNLVKLDHDGNKVAPNAYDAN